jgi:transposase-like protein
MARRRRSFDATFKAQVVLEWISGQTPPAELCRKHQISSALLSSWKAIVLQGLPQLFQPEEQRSQERQRIAELEQILGRKTMELELLKKVSILLDGPPSSNGES